MNRVKIPTPISGGVMLSYKCSAACRHCMYACSPRWDGDWLSEQDLARGLAQLAPHIQPSPWGRETMSLNHFDNYGNLVAGYCGGVSLGSWFDLDATLQEGIDVDERPVLGYLVAEDVEGLLHFAEQYGYEDSAGGYLSKCDLCLDLRTYLTARDPFLELAPRAFYAHLEDR